MINKNIGMSKKTVKRNQRDKILTLFINASIKN